MLLLLSDPFPGCEEALFLLSQALPVKIFPTDG